MVKLRKPIPIRPFYISDSDEVNAKWAKTFHDGLGILGPKYGVPSTKVNEVKAAYIVIVAFMGRLERAKQYYEACITCKNSYFNTDPNFPQGPVSFPSAPQEEEAPAPLPPNILKVFIEVAEFILLQNPIEADRDTLGLVEAEGKPVPPNHKPRPKVSDKKYPQLKYSVQGNTITITVKRGQTFRGMILRLIVDKEGRGQYVEAGVTNANSFAMVFTLPAGVHTGVWVFRAIFLEGQASIGEWSPELVVPLVKPVEVSGGVTLANMDAPSNDEPET